MSIQWSMIQWHRSKVKTSIHIAAIVKFPWHVCVTVSVHAQLLPNSAFFLLKRIDWLGALWPHSGDGSSSVWLGTAKCAGRKPLLVTNGTWTLVSGGNVQCLSHPTGPAAPLLNAGALEGRFKKWPYCGNYSIWTGCCMWGVGSVNWPVSPYCHSLSVYTPASIMVPPRRSPKNVYWQIGKQ